MRDEENLPLKEACHHVASPFRSIAFQREILLPLTIYA